MLVFGRAQWVKNPPALQETEETWVRSLGQEDPLEEETAAHASGRIPWSLEGHGPQGSQSKHTHNTAWWTVGYATCFHNYLYLSHTEEYNF